MYSLTPRQRVLVIQMVAAEARQRGPFLFNSAVYGSQGLTAPDGSEMLAEKEDILALVRNQLAEADFEEDGIAMVTIDLPARLAARSGFELSKERRLLEALYVMTNPSRPCYVTFEDLAKSSGLTDMEVRTHGIRLSQKEQATMTRGGLHLTGEGIAAIEDPEPAPEVIPLIAMPFSQTTLYTVGGNANFGNGDSSFGAVDMSTGDTYNAGQVGAQGPNARADHNTFQQVWQQSQRQLDLPTLAMELATLRKAMKNRGDDAEHDQSIGEVGAAELAAKKGDGSGALTHLKAAGKWALDTATDIGVKVAVEAITKAMGVA